MPTIRPTTAVKVLAMAGIGMVAGCIVGGLSLIGTVAGIGRRMVDPEEIGRVLGQMGLKNLSGQGNLDGYTAPLALSQGPMQVVVLERASDHQEVHLLTQSGVQSDRQIEDAVMFDQIESIMLTRDGHKLDFKSIEKKGDIELAGAKFKYREGPMSDENTHLYRGFMAFGYTAKKLVIVQAFRPGDSPVDGSALAALLQGLKGL